MTARARMPPVLVPATQSKSSRTGRPASFSNAISSWIRTKPLIPPPSRHSSLSVLQRQIHDSRAYDAVTANQIAVFVSDTTTAPLNDDVNDIVQEGQDKEKEKKQTKKCTMLLYSPLRAFFRYVRFARLESVHFGVASAYGGDGGRRVDEAVEPWR